MPRLVAVEGEVAEDGRYVYARSFAGLRLDALPYSFPVYRHPADESPPLAPFSPTVAIIREHVEKVRYMLDLITTLLIQTRF